MEDYVGVKTMAAHLGVAKSYVYKLISERRLPYYRVGGRFLFKVSEVDLAMQKEMRYA